MADRNLIPESLSKAVRGDQIAMRVLECVWPPPGGRETIVDEVHERCIERGYSDVLRNDIVRLLKILQRQNLGRFFAGRKGRPSRFIWNRAEETTVGTKGARIIGRESAHSEPGAVASRTDRNGEGDPAKIIEHIFAIRPTFRVSLSLPVDFSTQEADRLAEFIRMLPFGGQGRE